MQPTKGSPTIETKTPLQQHLPSVPWNSWWALVFVALVYYGAQFFAGLLVTFYPWLKHWSNTEATNWLNNSVGAQFTFILLAEIFTVGAVYYFLKYYKLKLPAIGLKRPRWRDLAYGLSAAPAYYVLYLLTVGVASHLITGLNINQQQNIGFTNVHGSTQMALTFISLVVLPPIAEEIMIRGFLYSSLKKALPTIWAVLATSAIFAAAHLPEGGSAGPLYIAALDTFILSLVLIYLREKTGSLWASITLHAIKNGVAFVALFALHAR